MQGRDIAVGLGLVVVALALVASAEDVELTPQQQTEALRVAVELCNSPDLSPSLVSLCDQLLMSTEDASIPEKRKASFIRFGKRSMDKRKASFIRFGRR